jgi:ATP-dependent DNA helicase DinG
MITRLTGITNKMVKASPTEEMVVDDLLGFLGNFPIVAHNISFDHNFLSSMCNRLGRDIPNFEKYDTLQLARSVLFQQPVFNLGALSEFFGLSSRGSHRAEKDTENTGLIFLEMLDILSTYPLNLISKVIAMLKGSKVPNQKLYVNLGNELTRTGDLTKGLNRNINKIMFKKNTFKSEGMNNLSEISAKDVFKKNGMLNNVYTNFEERKDQVKYSSLVEKVLTENEKFGVIEAGTGLGKSMAYLFGAYKSSFDLENHGPTIIACHTKPLQDQLFF